MEDVLKAFTSKKPVTSIELSDIEPRIVAQIIKDLKKYFFVGQGYSDPDLCEYGFSGDLFVSRCCRNLIDVMIYYSNNNFGMYDLFAGVAGVMLLDLLKFPLQKKVPFFIFLIKWIYLRFFLLTLDF